MAAGALGWRVGRTLLAIWALASSVFLLSHRDDALAVRLALPDAADLNSHNPAAPASARAAQAAVRHRLGLDLPLFYVGRAGPATAQAHSWRWHGGQNQYHQWLRRLFRGDLGTSFRTGEAVTSQLGAALQVTLPLMGTVALLAVTLAVGLAQRLAARPPWHRLVRVVLGTLHALPVFVVALSLLLVFANPALLEWFPGYGLARPAADSGVAAWGQLVAYLVLPVTTLTLTVLPELTLQLEASLAHELRTDYATTARAKGLSEVAVIRRHALRNALLPSLTQLTELLPGLVAGAVVVEVVFALPGMGRLLAQASATRDFPVLVGGILLVGAARLFALLLADMLYFWVDPRIRWQP